MQIISDISDRINGMRPAWRHILAKILNYTEEAKTSYKHVGRRKQIGYVQRNKSDGSFVFLLFKMKCQKTMK